MHTRVLGDVSLFTTDLTQNIYSIERYAFSCESWPNEEIIIKSVFICIITFFRPIVQLSNKGEKGVTNSTKHQAEEQHKFTVTRKGD